MTTYATLQEVKDSAGISDAIDDVALGIALESASRSVDSYCERRFFTAGTETRLYVADSSWVLDIDDVAGTAIAVRTSSASDGVFDTTWTADDWQAEPLNRTSTGMAFPVTRLRAVGDYMFPRSVYGRASVEVTAEFGFGTAIPDAVRQATILQTLRLFSRRNSPTGVLGFGDIGVARVSRFDYDVQGLLSPYRRTPVASA